LFDSIGGHVFLFGDSVESKILCVVRQDVIPKMVFLFFIFYKFAIFLLGQCL
jgi:hypothetical protein